MPIPSDPQNIEGREPIVRVIPASIQGNGDVTPRGHTTRADKDTEAREPSSWSHTCRRMVACGRGAVSCPVAVAARVPSGEAGGFKSQLSR